MRPLTITTRPESRGRKVMWVLEIHDGTRRLARIARADPAALDRSLDKYLGLVSR